MADISNTNIKIGMPEYGHMLRDWKAFKKLHGREPNYITRDNGKDTISKLKFIGMMNRVNAYNGTPPFVYVNRPATVVKPVIIKSAFHKLVESHVGFTYNTWKEFFDGMGGKGYLYYNNDVYPQGQALDRLKNNSGLNCSDISQIGHAVGVDLGLEMHYGHLKCQEGGHIVLIKGKIQDPVKDSEIWDLAKKISKSSPFVAGANDYWCKDTGKFISVDDAWLMSDDGR